MFEDNCHTGRNVSVSAPTLPGIKENGRGNSLKLQLGGRGIGWQRAARRRRKLNFEHFNMETTNSLGQRHTGVVDLANSPFSIVYYTLQFDSFVYLVGTGDVHLGSLRDRLKLSACTPARNVDALDALEVSQINGLVLKG